MPGSSVTIVGVEKSYDGFHVLKNINLEIKENEFFSLLGPSGCGKTTLLRIIAGFEAVDSGDVLLDGKSIVDIPPNLRPVNTIFQSYALFPHLNVYENIAFSLRLKKLSENEIKQRVEWLLNLVRLEEHAKKKPSQLSGGQKQRVSLARALANEPKVLLLDEPVSALDAKLRQELLIELDNLHDKVGITFIYVTHDQSEAISVSDHVAVMNNGVIVQYGTPYEIYESPADPFVAMFIGESNLMKGTVKKIISENYVLIEFPSLGEVICYRDKPVNEEDSVLVTLRPEKIRITHTRPTLSEGSFTNVIHGIVDETIYMGYQTKYFVKTDNGFILRVYKQHVSYLLDEKIIQWKDEVFLYWNPDDSFIVEVEED